MRSTIGRFWRPGLALKTALLAWAVTLITLLVFVSFIIPQQKREFLANLDSKAHGIAVSLRDVAAGAALNEDFSSVVDHCKEMLHGDSALDYLVITKNDGFSLIHERSGWRAETNIPKEWRPDKREPYSGIGYVPLLQRRVFHYSQPFDYSGIQWGWIHVGLSLDSYDRSVASVYWRTGLLAVGCGVFSLLASVVYARKLVNPILHVQGVVQKVAAGDLSKRALVNQGDELGRLAVSVNSMTEALLRRDRVLQSVRFAAQQFLSTTDWTQVIPSVLAKIGAAAEARRVIVFENHDGADGQLVISARFEWARSEEYSRLLDPALREIPGNGPIISGWVEELRRGEIVVFSIQDTSEECPAFLAADRVQSLILIPIMVEGVWWGALTLNDGTSERRWTEAEQDSLRAASDMLGAAMARQRTQDALVEAKATLEQRVQERTRELEEQMAAKERAHADLAEAQQRLVEASRQAGMAEVATGVLHNVGNVLNSINVSATLIHENLRQSEISSLVKVGELMKDHESDMNAFLMSDPKGRRLPGFIIQLAEHVGREHDALQNEHEQLVKNVEHIKQIVAMQQSYARVSGFMEEVSITKLVEDALQMNIAGLHRHGVRVERHFSEVPTLTVDKHKVLQILVNLVHNAKYALDSARSTDKRLTVDIGLNGGHRVKVRVNDNGIGISPENLTRIFSHGFTTRKEGHGFGLHSGANAAKEMGGVLKAESEGVGKGATFTLELPLTNGKEAQ